MWPKHVLLNDFMALTLNKNRVEGIINHLVSVVIRVKLLSVRVRFKN
jgi:hypothetical protein